MSVTAGFHTLRDVDATRNPNNVHASFLHRVYPPNLTFECKICATASEVSKINLCIKSGETRNVEWRPLERVKIVGMAPGGSYAG